MNTMPAAFRITGAARAHYNGMYSRMATRTCNDKPVYKLGGVYRYVSNLDIRPYDKFLFQPTFSTGWMVSSSNHITECESWGVIASDHNRCAARPDGGDCVGTWRESTSDCGEDSTWCPSPGLSVSDLACDGVICDARHRCESTMCAVAGACARGVWEVGWSGEHCETQVSYCDGDGGVSHTYRYNSDPTCRTHCPGCQPSQVVSAMQVARNESAVQYRGCRALAYLAYQSSGNQAAIVEAGGIDAVTAAMNRFSNDKNVQRYGCRALYNLMVDDNVTNQAAIREAGGNELVTAAMSRLSDESDLQRLGCAILTALDENGVNHCIEVIQFEVAVMRASPSNITVQVDGSVALHHLASDGQLYDYAFNPDPANQAAVREAGGIEAVTAAMDRFTDDDDVQQSGCWALRGLDIPTTLTAIAEVGIATKCRVGEYCDGSGGIMQTYRSRSDPTCRTNCQGPFNLKGGGCQAAQVVAAMSRFPDEKHVQTYGCRTLRDLADNSTANLAAIREGGGVAVVTTAMDRFSNNRNVRYSCQRALDNLDPCTGVDCGAHGSCDSAGSCVCMSGWSGDQCETFNRVDPPVLPPSTRRRPAVPLGNLLLRPRRRGRWRRRQSAAQSG
jgi:hypothetical protein